MSARRRVVLSLISHTNVGKTTLARTLVRRDVGEVADQAHVTEATERFVLFRSEAGDEVVLSDNPGFGDSARLLRRLRGLPNPLAWLVGQVWDRFRDRPLFCSQQAVRHVRDEADVVLYLANASEDPAEAGYLPLELELIAWIGRPVLLLLNQTGAPTGASAREAELASWHAVEQAHPSVRGVLPLDAFTRCWIQEGVLFERIRDLVPEDRRDLIDGLIAQWRSEQREILRAAVAALAAPLERAATDTEPVASGRRRAVRRAADALAARLADATGSATERLVALHGLEGEAAAALRVELADVTAPREPGDPWRRSLWGGVVGGALGGLAADLATGGLSLGGGTLVGAILGAAGAGGLTVGTELLRGGDAPRVAWAPAFLERLATDAVLGYLAVAHFGRGAGSFRVRDYPALFRDAAERALAPRREALRAAFRLFADPAPESRPAAMALVEEALGGAVRSALLELYPEGAAALR